MPAPGQTAQPPQIEPKEKRKKKEKKKKRYFSCKKNLFSNCSFSFLSDAT